MHIHFGTAAAGGTRGRERAGEREKVREGEGERERIEMKKTAVLLYDSFWYFEISPVLELLSLAGKPITVFGATKQIIKSEDGL